MPNGSSRWNGNYGNEETDRRKNYDVGKKELAGRMKANYQSPGLRGESQNQRAEAQYTSDRVPRRKE